LRCTFLPVQRLQHGLKLEFWRKRASFSACHAVVSPFRSG
jgi:hypothetical protein